MKFLTSTITLLFIIIGCNAPKKGTSNDGSLASNAQILLNDTSIIFSFEQTACYGTCPVHKIVVRKNGTATYHGERHVAQIGDYTAQVSKEQMELVYQKADEFHFFELDSNYSANMTDLPTTIITIANDRKSHTVSAYGEYPKNLKEFISFLGLEWQSIVWVKNK